MDRIWTQFAAIATARHCKRAFLDRPVPREVLEQVLAVAGHAPSTRNAQPWRVAVVTGAARDALACRLRAEFDRGAPPRPDYRNRPDTIDAVTGERARIAGTGLLRALGIARDDEAGRREHLRANLDFHGAPAALIFHLPADAAAGTFLELGFFLQNTMLGLVACGLGSCPQYSVAGYPDVLRGALGLGDRLVACGLAVGYPDPTASVNGFAPERAVLAEYVEWHDQPPPCG
ncbi:nitroreductase [Phytohabitans rumicis]|uniref:NADH dehydrogenase n=1 Tax=Phytohabitans rumicis TaxID=1076125 RepID=A0A6V8L8X1_9ACTN|nr:nitroreductase [Phytohabitans rumicis]GFJ92744.1 NADH dehydrogenase [Phytohabitans rumicis]